MPFWTWLKVFPLGALLAVAQTVQPMDPKADPAFEVATIKPSDPAEQGQGFQNNDRHILVHNETVLSMLVFTYGLQRKQIVNAPAWLETDRYDIEGIPDVEGTPNADQYRIMLRKLLTERFHLQIRRDQKEMPIYALRLAKGGAKLTKSASDPNAGQDQTGNGGAISDWRLTNNSMPEFAKFLQTQMERPVVDQTGLPGNYDFRLKWSTEQAQAADPSAPPTLFTAIQEQLGLKLEPTRGPAEVLVITHIDRPSAN